MAGCECGLLAANMRFNSRVVLAETDAVMEAIYRTITEQLNSEIPPIPPFSKGGKVEPFKETK
jgi:hypothetical protein